MGLFTSMDTSAAGLTAQRLRLETIANNIANAETTRGIDGGPYRRQTVVFRPRQTSPFQALLAAFRRRGEPAGAVGRGVNVTGIVNDDSPLREKYDPGHPDADERGYVQLPNVNVVTEMVDMISATRGYEANVTAVQAAKDMARRALDIARGG